jgi:DNA-binding NarL/FixJ family response regulator
MEGFYVNVLIVEDSAVIRDQLVTLLCGLDGVKIAGCAETEDEAVQLADTCAPDLVLLDISLRKGNGINVLRRLRTKNTPAPIIAMLTNMSDHYRLLTAELGADAYFDKTLQIDEALHQIRHWADYSLKA